jgi:hypothetical protein
MDVLESITTTPTCQTCRYYEPAADIDGILTYGVCRRYPPQRDPVEIGDTDWCGEYTHG